MIGFDAAQGLERFAREVGHAGTLCELDQHEPGVGALAVEPQARFERLDRVGVLTVLLQRTSEIEPARRIRVRGFDRGEKLIHGAFR